MTKPLTSEEKNVCQHFSVREAEYIQKREQFAANRGLTVGELYELPAQEIYKMNNFVPFGPSPKREGVLSYLAENIIRNHW